MPFKSQEKSRDEKIDELMEFIKQTPRREMKLKIDKEFSELPERYVVLLMEKTKELPVLLAELTAYFTQKGIAGIFITANKPLVYLLKLFEQHKIDISSIAFLDAITKRAGEQAAAGKNFHYIDSPQNLTELNIELDEALERLKGKEKFLVIDSISTLLVYNKEQVVEKFVHSIAGKLRANNVKAVLLMASDSPASAINVLMQFCDRSIEI